MTNSNLTSQTLKFIRNYVFLGGWVPFCIKMASHSGVKLWDCQSLVLSTEADQDSVLQCDRSISRVSALELMLMRRTAHLFTCSLHFSLCVYLYLNCRTANLLPTFVCTLFPESANMFSLIFIYNWVGGSLDRQSFEVPHLQGFRACWGNSETASSI